MDTPYQWTKQVASHWGGTRNGTIVHWPGGFAAKGEVRTQFHHVIDVAPTVLEAAGLPEPTVVDGVEQRPIEGVSMAYSFDDADARRAPRDAVLRDVLQPRHLPRGLDRGHPAQHAVGDGAAARRSRTTCGSSTTPRPTGASRTTWPPSMPEKLAELQELWLTEARKYNVLPLDDRRIERFNPDLAGRPVLVTGNTQMLYGGMGRLTEASILNIKNKSHAVTAEVEVPEAGAEGVIIAQGGAFGGWSLYAKDGRPRTATTCSACSASSSRATRRSRPATHQVRMEFGYDGGGLGKGGTVELFVDGTKVGEGRVDATCPWSSPPTRRPTSAATRPPRSARLRR